MVLYNWIWICNFPPKYTDGYLVNLEESIPPNVFKIKTIFFFILGENKKKIQKVDKICNKSYIHISQRMKGRGHYMMRLTAVEHHSHHTCCYFAALVNVLILLLCPDEASCWFFWTETTVMSFFDLMVIIWKVFWLLVVQQLFILNEITICNLIFTVNYLSVDVIYTKSIPKYYPSTMNYLEK